MISDIGGKAAAPFGGKTTASAIRMNGTELAKRVSLFAMSTRTRRGALLAASVAIAAATGAMAGALSVSGFMRPAPEATEVAPVATIYETRALQGSITQLRSDLAAVKISVESATKSAGGQFARIAERFDRIDRSQPAPARETTARETTASVQPVPPLQPAVAGTPAQPQPRVIQGWSVRDVYLGMALIEDRRASKIEVMPGDMIRGIGRIESIRKQQDGRWVVVTSRGLIVSAR